MQTYKRLTDERFKRLISQGEFLFPLSLTYTISRISQDVKFFSSGIFRHQRVYSSIQFFPVLIICLNDLLIVFHILPWNSLVLYCLCHLWCGLCGGGTVQFYSIETVGLSGRRVIVPPLCKYSSTVSVRFGCSLIPHNLRIEVRFIFKNYSPII